MANTLRLYLQFEWLFKVGSRLCLLRSWTARCCCPVERMAALRSEQCHPDLLQPNRTPALRTRAMGSSSSNSQSTARCPQSQSGPEESVPRRWAAANPGEERRWLPDDIQYKPVKVGSWLACTGIFGAPVKKA